MPKLAYITFHGKGIMVSAVTLMKNVQRSWLVSNLGYLHTVFLLSCLWMHWRTNFTYQMFLECYLFNQIQTLDQTTKITKVHSHFFCFWLISTHFLTLILRVPPALLILCASFATKIPFSLKTFDGVFQFNTGEGECWLTNLVSWFD